MRGTQVLTFLFPLACLFAQTPPAITNQATAQHALSSAGRGSETLAQVAIRPNRLGWRVEQPKTEVWKRADLQRLRRAPLVDGSEVFVLNDSELHCLYLATGKTRWTAKLPKESDPWVSPLHLSEDRVFFSDENYQLFALDRKTGEQVWKTQLEKHKPNFENSTRSQPVSQPSISGGTLFVGTWGLVVFSHVGELHALDLATGKLLWTTKLKDGMDQPPILARDMVLARGGKAVTRVNAKSGALDRVFAAESGFQTRVVTENGKAWFNSGGWLQALDLETGETKRLLKTNWSVLPFPAEGMLITPKYSVFGRGTVVVLDPITGKTVWEGKDKLIGDPVAFQGGVIFPTSDDVLVAQEMLTGQDRFRIKLLGELTDTLLPMANGLLVQCLNGKSKNEEFLIALEASKGTEQWRWKLPKDMKRSLVFAPEGLLAPAAEGLMLFR